MMECDCLRSYEQVHILPTVICSSSTSGVLGVLELGGGASETTMHSASGFYIAMDLILYIQRAS